MYSSCTIWKKSYQNNNIFHSIGANLTPLLPPKTTLTFLFFFFADFQWIMLGDSINMNNLCCNPAVLKKKLVKRLKNCSFWPNLHERGPYRSRPKWKTNFFFRYNKIRSSGFRNFLSYQSIICFGWVMNLFQFWVMFFDKKVSFLAKIAGYGTLHRIHTVILGKYKKA